MESVSLYSEARNEYIKQLATWVVPQFVEFFRKEYDRIAASDGKRVMAAFQTWCSEVPRWNQDVIDTHVNDLLDNCRCDYIEDLMTAVFIAHTKMLTAIRVGGKQKKLQITLPKLDHFLHRVFVECARAFWKAPFLFSDEVSMIERQKNVLQAEAMCVEALSGAVRSLLPIKNILRDNLLEEEEEVEKVEKPKRKKKYDSSSDESSEDELPKRKSRISLHGGEEIEVDPNPVFTLPKQVPEVPQKVPEVPQKVPEVPQKVPEVPEVPQKVPEVPQKEQVMPEVEVSEIEVSEVPQKVPEVLEKTPPSILKPVSATKEPTPVQLIKDETIASADHFVIETEPTVNFSPYEMVYDENTSEISEMRYAPKMSVEEMPDKPAYEPVYYEDEDQPLPKIQIGSEVGMSATDMEVVGDMDDIGLSDADFETI